MILRNGVEPMNGSSVQLTARDFRQNAVCEHYVYFKVLSYGIAPWLCVLLNSLRITPNQVTLAGIALAVPAVYFNLTGQYLLAILVFHLFFMCDAADGILARATGRKSKLGAYLDDMAHHMFHVPFLLSMAYSEYGAGRRELAALVALFAVVNTLFRAQLDIIEKSELSAPAKAAPDEEPAVRIGQRIRNVVLGSFNFPNVLVWMTLLFWNSGLLVTYFAYANVMTIVYYFYVFSKTLRRGSVEVAP